MKDRIQSAQIILPCANLNETLEFFVERLGFRIETIFPADAPAIAVVSGYGICLRLENSSAPSNLTINLVGNFAAEIEREIFSPDGVCVRLIDEKKSLEIPEGRQEFVISTLEGENAWSVGRAGMQYRDLIPSRLGGRFIASHIRIPHGGEVPDYVHFHKIRFQMIYCISGWARLVYEDQGAPFLMNAGDCVLQPPEIRHRVLECSDEFEVLEIGCPSLHETFADHDLQLPNDKFAPERLFNEQQFLHHIAAETNWKSSLFEGFETCNTKMSRATGKLADVRTLRAIADSRLSVRHSLGFLFFYILKGKLQISDSKGEIYHLEKGGSFVLPKDNFYSIDAAKGLEMLRVSLPAK
ncbi:hypothetical protein BH10ACI1_BH10ACI1_25150 [soil metagenome]